MSRFPGRLAFALGLCLSLAAQLLADTCPGCAGSGRIPCGGCVSFPGLGICQNCTGNGSLYDSLEKRQKTCDRCHGSGKCAACGGNGAACMVCQGTGQVQGGGQPGGGGQPAASAPSPEQARARIGEALEPLGTLVGDWSGSGKTRGKPFDSSLRCVTVVDETYLCIEWTTTSEGTSTSSVCMLTYDPTARVYVLHFFSAPGLAHKFTGTGTQDGNGIDWKPVDGRNVRACWRLDTSGAFEIVVEGDDGTGWKELSRENLRRVEGDGEPGDE